MIPRRYERPDHSFFLFGPRGAGKTTWLEHVLPDALWFELLHTQVVLALGRQSESFRQQVEALRRGRWVVVDEVQRLPALLDEVQALMTEHGRRYRFALSGSRSSAVLAHALGFRSGFRLDPWHARRGDRSQGGARLEAAARRMRSRSNGARANPGGG